MFHLVGVGGIIICYPGFSTRAIVVKALRSKGIIIFIPFFYLKITSTNNLPQLKRANKKHAPRARRAITSIAPGI